MTPDRAEQPSRSRLRRWLPGVVVALAVVVAGVVVAVSRVDDGDDHGTPSPTVEAGRQGTAGEPRAYGVGRRDVTFVDRSRPTGAAPDGTASVQPDRTLRTAVLYPTEVAVPSGTSTSDARAEPLVAPGRFPLVVFSHGSGGDPDVYVPMAEPVVRAGYVVALPAFPVTSLSDAGYGDVRNQPADVSFVIDQLLALAREPDSWLSGRLDAERIAAAGHSLGAITTVALTYDRCCVDPRIDAAVAVSGMAVPSGPGGLDRRPPTPLLLVHGEDDDVIPVEGSDDLFARATGPAYYLRLDEGDHTDIGFGDDGALTGDAVLAFLDAELKDQPDGLTAMPTEVEDSGRGEWRVRRAG